MPLPLFSALCDGFGAASVNAALWAVALVGGTLAQSGGVVTADRGIRTQDRDDGWTLDAGGLVWKVQWNDLATLYDTDAWTLDLFAANNSDTSTLASTDVQELHLYWGYDSIGAGPDSLQVEVYQGPGGTFTPAVPITITLADKADMVWWRILPSGGDLLIQTSPDAATWTTRFDLTPATASGTFGLWPRWVPGSGNPGIVLDQVGLCSAGRIRAFAQVIG